MPISNQERYEKALPRDPQVMDCPDCGETVNMEDVEGTIEECEREECLLEGELPDENGVY